MARTKADIRTTYDRIAESYAARRRVPWPEVRSFIDSLPRGSRVLDLGAGHGRHATILADRGHRAVALDFSRRLLLIGRSDEPAVPKRVLRREPVHRGLASSPARVGPTGCVGGDPTRPTSTGPRARQCVGARAAAFSIQARGVRGGW